MRKARIRFPLFYKLTKNYFILFYILNSSYLAMVRVSAIYHFASQSIRQLAIEELSAVCFIPPNEIALARNSDHTIEIRELQQENLNESRSDDETEAVKSFSSVDDVVQLIFSKVGNFLVTLESRLSSYEKAEIRYVRIYCNWDRQSNPSQSLRARIAGKITPMKKTLEMIELPLSLNPSSIAVCQSTGNILVNQKNILQLFQFKYCTNETSKLQYIDFFEAPFQIELDFSPAKILLNENVISCCNKQFFFVFKVVEKMDGNSSLTSDSNICTSTELPQLKDSMTMNLDQDVDFQAICDKDEINGIPFAVKLKSTMEESMRPMGDDDSEMRPQTVNEIGATIKYLNILPSSFALPTKFAIEHLLQLKLQSMRISGVMRENVDVFKCMFMMPLYTRNAKNSEESFFMHSKFQRNFRGVAILITTQQDGYLYQLDMNTRDNDSSKSFLNVYPFTSSVVDVYINDNVLHALCENGIESYTHRIGQRLFGNDEMYKNLSTTISLVNLRPFLNVQFMIPSQDNLVLLSSETSQNESTYDSVNWTIYNLRYPTMETIYQDFKEFADKSLRKYPTVYLNLLEEIHLMIRCHMALGRLELADSNCEFGTEMKLIWDECENLLKDSSLILGDCYVL